MQKFRKALLLVLKAIGVSKISKRTGLRRESIYRMLSKDGNPEFRSMLVILKAIGMHLWVVEKEFIYAASTTKRYKNAVPDRIPDRKTRGFVFEIMK